jgi:hypothetical protein
VTSLRELVDEAVDANWWHPAWWAFLLGTSALERIARPAGPELYAAFLGANGGPRSDTFMGAPPRAGVDRHREAVRRARAAWQAIEALDGTLPGQPLRVSLVQRDGWLRAAPLSLGRPVRFETDRGVIGVELTAHADDDRLARLLAAGQLASVERPAPVLVSLLPGELGDCRHLHRRGWSDGAGPWLGVGDAGPLAVVTTCHFAVDGYGHAQLTRAILGGPGAGERVSGSGELGLACALLPHVPFAAAAHATGLALAARFGMRRGRTPSFQIPFVPGDRSDPDRLRRRVLFTLTSVGRDEPRDRFAARLRAQLEREAVTPGLLTRVLAATVNAPLPDGLRRRLLAGNREPSSWLPPTEALPGRASLAYLRFPAAERPVAPLYAGSSPPIWDEAGSASLTLIDHGERTSVSVATSGALDPSELLQTWQRALASVHPRTADATPGSAP